MKRQRGVTLIELVVALVIIGIAGAAIVGVYTTVVARSADPMIRQQALALAEAYMEEIMARPFEGSSAPGDARDSLDNLQAYDGLQDQPPRNVLGDTIAGLDAYSVTVTVDEDTALGLGDDARRITVRVRHDAGTVDFRLSAWRARD